MRRCDDVGHQPHHLQPREACFFFYEITMIMEKVMIVIIIVNITVNIFNWPAFIIKGRAVILVHSTEVLSLAQSMRTCSIEYEHTVCERWFAGCRKKLKEAHSRSR